jgi:hypothetical protein
MSEHKEERDDPAMLAKMGYDTRDLAAEKAGKFVSVSAVIVVLMCLVSFGVIRVFESVHGRTLVDKEGDSRQQFRRMPPAGYPLLQSNRTAQGDTYDLKKKDKEALNTYGPSESAPGAFKVPIEKAMKAVAEEGLPSRPNPVDGKDPL